MPYSPPSDERELLALQALGPLSSAEGKYAPTTLFVAGDESLLGDTRRVAIVGARDASPEGVRRARRLAGELAKAGVVVVSGLAAGIDRAAHEGAMQAGGRTIAVLGTPISRAYPAANAALQERIYSDHLLVSQFPPGHRTFKSDFVKRNRTMALLSHASVIVEANDGSGSLSQAAETQRIGRPLFLMQSVLGNERLQWPGRFIASGALVLEQASQVLTALVRENRPVP